MRTLARVEPPFLLTGCAVLAWVGVLSSGAGMGSRQGLSGCSGARTTAPVFAELATGPSGIEERAHRPVAAVATRRIASSTLPLTVSHTHRTTLWHLRHHVH